jgi:hypothetical protein
MNKILIFLISNNESRLLLKYIKIQTLSVTDVISSNFIILQMDFNKFLF